MNLGEITLKYTLSDKWFEFLKYVVRVRFSAQMYENTTFKRDNP